MFSRQSKSILKSYAILVFISTFIITGYLIHLHGHLEMFHFGAVNIESTSTTSTSTTDHHHADKTFISEMKRRIQNIDTVCKNTRHEIKSETVYTSHLFWFPNHNIAYCPVLKAAHSTLMDYMIQVSNVRAQNPPHLDSTHDSKCFCLNENFADFMNAITIEIIK